MKVCIKDFRVQEDSFITMDGLTVIQGKNTTEESILESALYSYFHDKDLSGVQVSEISREYSNVILIKDAYEITSLLEELSKEETKEEEKCLSRIKEIINEIVPGIYDIDESGAVYIRDGRFIKLSSLSEEFKLFLFLSKYHFFNSSVAFLIISDTSFGTFLALEFTSFSTIFRA